VSLEFLHYDNAKKVWPTFLSQRFVLSSGACALCPEDCLMRMTLMPAGLHSRYQFCTQPGISYPHGRRGCLLDRR
jgi:hypothetical protein